MELEQRFISAMDDDLNSSGGLAVLFDLAKPLRALANRLERGEDAALPEPELKGSGGALAAAATPGGGAWTALGSGSRHQPRRRRH